MRLHTCASRSDDGHRLIDRGVPPVSRSTLGSRLPTFFLVLGKTIPGAADGQEGIERYRTTPTELVITDILMPEREGLERIMALRREFPDVKIIAVSGGTGPLDFLHVAAWLGAQRTFRKPFDYRELLAAVQELVQ